MHGYNVVIKSRILRVTSAGQFELLCSMGELECSFWMGRVWQQGALSLQHIGHSFQELPETESQGSLPQTVQLLTGSSISLNYENHYSSAICSKIYLIKSLSFIWKFPCIPQDLLHISL